MRKNLATFAPPAAIVGGLLWIIFTILLMLHPLGEPLRAAGSTDNAPPERSAPVVGIAITGAIAFVLLALALLATVRRLGLPLQRSGRFGVALGWAAITLAVAAAGASLVQMPAVTFAALTLGQVLLAFGVLLVAVDAAATPASAASASALFVVGAAGMLALLAQALVAATSWMLPVYAALVMAVYGLAWVRFGNWLYRQPQANG